MWTYHLNCDCLKVASKVVQSKFCKLRKIYNKLDLTYHVRSCNFP